MFNAYRVAEDLSGLENNIARADYVQDCAAHLANYLGLKLEIQELPVSRFLGNRNIVIRSGYDFPLLLCAHYDACLDSETRTIPGANDNGSGVGTVLEVASRLSGLPVDVALFGSEETDFAGSLHFSSRELPYGVVNIDSCGSGEGIYIPKMMLGCDNFEGYADPDLKDRFFAVADSMGVQTYDSPMLGGADSLVFNRWNIPGLTILGYSPGFFGTNISSVSAALDKVVHTSADTIEWVDELFLEKIVGIVIGGIESLIKSQPTLQFGGCRVG